MRPKLARFHLAGIAPALRAGRFAGRGLTDWLKAAILAVARTRRHRREVAFLQTLDEAMLRDMGLTRADVRWAASTPFWRDPAPMLMAQAGPRGRDRASALASVPHAPSIAPALAGRAGDLARAASADVHSPQPPFFSTAANALTGPLRSRAACRVGGSRGGGR